MMRTVIVQAHESMGSSDGSPRALSSSMKIYNRLLRGRRTAIRLDVTFLTAISVIATALIHIVV